MPPVVNGLSSILADIIPRISGNYNNKSIAFFRQFHYDRRVSIRTRADMGLPVVCAPETPLFPTAGCQKEAITMSEPTLISPLLDGFTMGQPMGEHDGVSCCPAIREDKK